MLDEYVITQYFIIMLFFFFSSRRRHTRYIGDWSSDVCSSDLQRCPRQVRGRQAHRDRRAVYRDEGADRRFLAVAGEIAERGDRLAEAGAVPGGRGGDSPGIRGGRFRCHAQTRIQGARGAAARAYGVEEEELTPAR